MKWLNFYCVCLGKLKFYETVKEKIIVTTLFKIFIFKIRWPKCDAYYFDIYSTVNADPVLHRVPAAVL